ncbi:MAG: DUF63 family protein [Nanopusillaceae archaeon]
MFDLESFLGSITKSGGYTVTNTFFYSFLYILAFLLLYFLTKSKKIIIDKYFNLNFILSFSIIVLIRVSMDLNWIREIFIFYTPYMQILVLSLFSATLLYSEKRKELFYFYLILTIITIALFIRKIPNIIIFSSIILIIGMIMFIFYKEKKQNYYLLPILSQILDGVYGNIGILVFGYSPKHVMHKFILNYFGIEQGVLMFLFLKFFILILTIFIIEKYIKDDLLKEILYLGLFYVGYNAGLRNSLLLAFNEI